MQRLAIKILMEPLVHFMVIGALMFGVYSYKNPQTELNRHIAVDAQKITQLISEFHNHKQRTPSPEELKAIVDDYVLEEMYYRKALSLALDQNDPVVRQRLRQKMEMLNADVTIGQAPTQSELNEYFALNSERYRNPNTYSFEQAFFSIARSKTDLESIIAQARLAAKNQEVIHGDTSALAARFSQVTESAIIQQFGAPFFNHLKKTPQGQWSDTPIESTLGLHLVNLVDVSVGQIPALDTIRDTVAADWVYQKTQELRRQFSDQLLSEYTVTVDWPKH